ncbi:MAG: hypothetical protein WAS73_13525 [Defluviicoccus sp.]
MSRPAAYRMRVFNRAGASLADEERTLPAHASERVRLNDLAAGEEGQILITPVDDEDDEFPAMIILADPVAEAGVPNRLMPLMRIEEMPDENEEEEHEDEEKGEEEEEKKEKKKGKKGKQHDD